MIKKELKHFIERYVANGEVFSSDLWDKSGVYAADILYTDSKGYVHEITTYTGTSIGDDKHPNSLRNRVYQHIYNWCSHPTVFLGIDEDELKKHIKFKFSIVLLTDSLDIALRTERVHILYTEPWLQYSSYRFCSKTNYTGTDLCIERKLRPDAWKSRLLREGIMTDPLDLLIYQALEGREPKRALKTSPNDLVISEMDARRILPKNSKAHLALKQLVDRSLPKSSVRGANYNYIVTLTASILSQAITE